MKRIGRRAGRQTAHSIRLWTCGLWINIGDRPGLQAACQAASNSTCREYSTRARKPQNRPKRRLWASLAGDGSRIQPSSIETVALWISPLIGSQRLGRQSFVSAPILLDANWGVKSVQRRRRPIVTNSSPIRRPIAQISHPSFGLDPPNTPFCAYVDTCINMC